MHNGKTRKRKTKGTYEIIEAILTEHNIRPKNHKPRKLREHQAEQIPVSKQAKTPPTKNYSQANHFQTTTNQT